MTISDEGVEAAAEAMEDAALSLIGSDLGTSYRNDIARAALEAAAPFIRAQAVEDAAKLVTPDMDPELCRTIYDPWDVAEWLRARAAAERGGE